MNWVVQGATAISINNGIGNVAATGSTTVTPTQTTTYTLTATSTDGRSVTASVIVTVSNGQLARIVSFTANPVTIDVGGSSQLCWVVENATTVSIAPGVGTVAASACVTVMPTTTTTYVLTAVNGQGQVTAKNGAISALFLWLGFVVTTVAVNNGSSSPLVRYGFSASSRPSRSKTGRSCAK